jgi:hypothetical protein
MCEFKAKKKVIEENFKKLLKSQQKKKSLNEPEEIRGEGL